MQNFTENNDDHMLYQSFLLRLWREKPDNNWRISIENIFSGEKLLFPGLAELFVYLCAQCGRNKQSRSEGLFSSRLYIKEE